MALINDSDLCNDDVFRSRAKMALVSTALTIQAEATNTANHAARSAYAIRLLADPIGFAMVMCPGMTADGATTSSSTDAQLKTQAAAIFNAYAVQT